ncbi:hypothetical protein [Gorillibacterium massiliense]|uniref:hypothetical protein n=1 Tax=Gorillibacterium massiliense TaxID=1280390 RepID=UPI0004BC6120|nr:hypothetical protein [Gorillibacterium massiliense]
MAELAMKGFPFAKSPSLSFDFGSADHDIADPFGGSLREYRLVGDEIEASLQKLVQKLKNE